MDRPVRAGIETHIERAVRIQAGDSVALVPLRGTCAAEIAEIPTDQDFSVQLERQGQTPHPRRA